jgi:NADPH-dependent 2,4-dienoyl-CoA reductase/sulfur reductase-like enzyme
MEGRISDIRKCIACMECSRRFTSSLSVRCTVNAAIGREREFIIRPAQIIKNVVVIGGGPAGMEAARVAALRGHTVTLLEQNKNLGGQLRIASIPPFREDINNLTEYFVNQMAKLYIRVKLNTKANLASVKKLKPDVVILAAGATPIIPKIAGISGDNVVLANEVLNGKKDTGQIVIVVGGGMVGAEVAEFLAAKGKSVTIIEMLDQVCIDMERRSKRVLLSRLASQDIKILTGVKLNEIKQGTINTINKNMQINSINADSVVLALGVMSNNELAEQLSTGEWEFYSTGDCNKPGKIIDAVFEGSYIAHNI